MFKKFLLGIILNGAALYGVIYLLPEIQYTGGIKFFVIGGLVMGILNSIVKPILKLLTLPIQIVTLGLSLIILNGIIFWIFKVIIDTIAIEGISVTIPGLTTYIFAGALFGLINWVEHLIIHNK
ncbi:MAG: phage holin family protein [Patescibacteria group bacterium]